MEQKYLDSSPTESQVALRSAPPTCSEKRRQLELAVIGLMERTYERIRGSYTFFYFYVPLLLPYYCISLF